MQALVIFGDLCSCITASSRHISKAMYTNTVIVAYSSSRTAREVKNKKAICSAKTASDHTDRNASAQLVLPKYQGDIEIILDADASPIDRRYHIFMKLEGALAETIR